MYFEPEIHRALRLKAAASDKSIFDMVNEAVKLTLAEDAEDLGARSWPGRAIAAGFGEDHAVRDQSRG